MELDLRNICKFLVFVILLLGCSSGTLVKSYTREGVDLSYIKKVAVMKFDNHSKDKFAADRIRDIVANEIMVLGLFDVVDRTFVDSVFEEEVGRGFSGIDKGTVRRIARRLGVQALMFGSVDDYRMERKGPFSYPVVALSLRLVDGRSGEVVWSASGTKTGYSFWGRLFGLKPKDSMQISFELVEDMLRELR